MGSLTVSFSVLALALVGIIIWVRLYRKKLDREKADLEEAVRELRAGFEEQLTTAVPHILHRPTRLSTKVESHQGSWLSQKECTLLLKVMLSEERDLKEVERMADEFVKEFLKIPGREFYQIRIIFPGVQRTIGGGVE